MKKTTWVWGTISLAYFAWCFLLLTKAIQCTSPSHWGSGLCFLDIEVASVWGYRFMHLIGGQAYLLTTSPWMYLIPVLVNTFILFGILYWIGNLGKKFIGRTQQ